MRALRGERYLEGCSPSFVEIVRDKLPYWGFYEAGEFYADMVGHLSNNEMALLGCNDRYFLLTGLCNRVDMIHPWLYDRARELEAEPDGYLDLWARGHGKSSWGTFAGVIQEVFCDPEIRVGIFGNTKDISRPFLSQIKEEFDSNELLHEIYHDVLWENTKDAPSWAVDKGITVKRKGNPKEATIEAHGLIDAMPTGRHFPLLVYDDIITEKNVTNPDQIRKATERVELSDNLGVGDGTRKWYFGTRYHFGDSYGHLIEHGIVEPRLHPATEDGTLDGKPVLLSQEAWDEKKRSQRSQIAAQMLQNPIAGQENTFYTKWLRPYWVRPIMMNVYITVDPSKGRTKSSDRTAIVVTGIDTLGNKYLLDGYCHRMPMSDRWKRIRELHEKWSGMPGVQMIKVGYERYGMQVDVEYLEERMRLEKYHFEVIELNWTGQTGEQSKTNRVERLEPDFRQGCFLVPGKVWYPSPEGFVSTWAVEEGKEDLTYKPMLGAHKLELKAKAASEMWRIFDALRRVDEDGNIYDLTRVFFEEFRFWPFSPRRDFLDAMSRIYDLEPIAAVKFESVEVEDFADF